MRGDVIGIIGVVIDELVIGNASIVAVHSGGCVVIPSTIEILVVVVIVGIVHVELVLWFHFLMMKMIKTLITNKSKLHRTEVVWVWWEEREKEKGQKWKWEGNGGWNGATDVWDLFWLIVDWRKRKEIRVDFYFLGRRKSINYRDFEEWKEKKFFLKGKRKEIRGTTK